MASKPSARSEARNLLAGLYERGEEVVNVFLEELASNPKLRDQVGKTFERALDAKKHVDRNMQTILGLLNVPSRADYHRVLTKLEALQGSLVNLNIKVDRLLAAQHVHPPDAPTQHAAAPAVPKQRPRRPTR